MSEPAGTQTSFNVKALEALATARTAAALLIPPPVDWVPAFAGMTMVGMRTPLNSALTQRPPPNVILGLGPRIHRATRSTAS
ncbi:MAG: hypothetical protein B7Y80_01950 [Hyphomicrobium sp. 32-62-53]|nr:MAG: hypothetical protein B7Z29_02300 [Hyphomicrobium sp. 12-62-95]OYY01511.1 MAG: hypothetical protein B7Y80_01950 [Hyphomicrobium sp. 32-62-53]